MPAARIRDAFQEHLGAENCADRQMFYFSRPDHIISLHPFTVTNVNVTPATRHLTGRSTVTLAGAGASTDGSNFCYAVANHRFVAGKAERFLFSFNTADMTNHSIVAGFNIVSTGIAALYDGGTPSTDYFLLNKVAATTNWKLRVRKASGTEEATTFTLPATAASATWYDWEMFIRPDGTTAGKGVVQVFLRTAGAASVKIADINIATQLPDTVSTALCMGFLAGGSVTTALDVSRIGYEQAY